MSETRFQGELQPCCADRVNRQPQPADPARPGWSLELCGVCGRRHITLRVREAVLHTPTTG